MIVISGALVLVALVLLVLGLTMTDLDFVYGSIGVSLVSFVFLVIGILQRRGEPAPASSPPVSDDAPAGAPAERAVAQPVPAAAVAKAGATGTAPVRGPDVEADELEPGGGPVLVVAGRPRYHVEGCRYLAGKQAEEIDVLDAREDGFSPCGVCKPDQVLEELYGEVDEDELEPLEDEPAEDAADEEPAPARGGRRGGSTAVGPSALELGGATSPRSRGSKASAGKAAPAKAAAKAPAKAPAKAAKATQTAARTKVVAPAAGGQTADAAAPSGRTKVVVIPDRDKFHAPGCRFVRDALGTEDLTRAQAGKQGYRACGVCKP